MPTTVHDAPRPPAAAAPYHPRHRPSRNRSIPPQRPALFPPAPAFWHEPPARSGWRLVLARAVEWLAALVEIRCRNCGSREVTPAGYASDPVMPWAWTPLPWQTCRICGHSWTSGYAFDDPFLGR